MKQTVGEGRWGYHQVARQFREGLFGEAGRVYGRTKPVLGHEEGGCEGVGPHFGGVFRLGLVVDVPVEVDVLVVAGKQMAEFVSECETLSGRNVEVASTMNLTCRRRGRQAIETGAEFDNGHVGAENLLDEVHQVADSNRVTGLLDSPESFTGQRHGPARRTRRAPRTNGVSPPRLGIAEVRHVGAQCAVPSAAASADAGVAACGPRGYGEWRLLPRYQPVHRHPHSSAIRARSTEEKPAPAAQRLGHLRLVEADRCPNSRRVSPDASIRPSTRSGHSTPGQH